MSESETLRIVKTRDLHDPFIVAGSRAYLIGAQDGSFPPMGWHTPGEMGGMWAHPIKLLDGFWLQIDGEWLEGAHTFTSEPFACTQVYDLPGGLRITRRQVALDDEPAVIVRYAFTSNTARRLALRVAFRSSLQPVWPGRSESSDVAQYSDELRAWTWSHPDEPWHVVAGVIASTPSARSTEPLEHSAGAAANSTEPVTPPETQPGNGVTTALDLVIPVGPAADAQLEIVIAGSHLGFERAAGTYRRVRANVRELEEAKQRRYSNLLSASRLSISDPLIERAWEWMKCNVDWLVRDVPGIGRGLGGGVDDYPWWFGCDSAYSLLAALALGQHEVTISTIDLLLGISRGTHPQDGHVIHECNTAGKVTNQGSTAETPHLITTVWETFRWTGDLAFLRRSYRSCRQGLLDWVLGECTRDGDPLPYGFGITEREGLDLQCIDTAAHTVRALEALAQMADTLADDTVAACCLARAAETHTRLEEAFWVEEEGLYGDMLATPCEMIPRLEAWLAAPDNPYYTATLRAAARAELTRLLELARSDPEPDHKRPWLIKNWVVVSPMEAQLTVPERAARVLDRLETPEFTGPWGMYLSGIDRCVSMSINTGVLAAAEAAYGRVDAALRYVRMVADTLPVHMPGAISEISPDTGCFAQAWSAYAIVWPIAAHVFGISPNAYQRELHLTPCFPASWPEARLTNLRIGAAGFDLHWTGERLFVSVSEPGWTVTCTTVPFEVVSCWL